MFKPGVAKSTSAAAMDATSAIAEAFNRQLDRIVDPVDDGSPDRAGLRRAVVALLRIGRRPPFATRSIAARRVLVIGQPRMQYGEKERHASQQEALAGMIARDFAGDDRVRYVDMGQVVDLSDNSIAFDGMHLNARGNGMVAAALAEPVRQMVALGLGAAR